MTTTGDERAPERAADIDDAITATLLRLADEMEALAKEARAAAAAAAGGSDANEDRGIPGG